MSERIVGSGDSKLGLLDLIFLLHLPTSLVMKSQVTLAAVLGGLTANCL